MSASQTHGDTRKFELTIEMHLRPSSETIPPISCFPGCSFNTSPTVHTYHIQNLYFLFILFPNYNNLRPRPFLGGPTRIKTENETRKIEQNQSEKQNGKTESASHQGDGRLPWQQPALSNDVTAAAFFARSLIGRPAPAINIACRHLDWTRQLCVEGVLYSGTRCAIFYVPLFVCYVFRAFSEFVAVE